MSTISAEFDSLIHGRTPWIVGLVTILMVVSPQVALEPNVQAMEPISTPPISDPVPTLAPIPTQVPIPTPESAEVRLQEIKNLVAQKYGIPPAKLEEIMRGILRTETNGDENEKNPAQIKPDTAKESEGKFIQRLNNDERAIFNNFIRNLTESERSVVDGEITYARYAQMIEMTYDDFPAQTREDLAIGSYNRGPGFMDKIMAFYAANHPGKDWRKTATLKQMTAYLDGEKESARFETAFGYKHDDLVERLRLLDLYGRRVQFLKNPENPKALMPKK